MQRPPIDLRSDTVTKPTPGHAAGDGRGGGRRRRIRRRPDGQATRSQDRRVAREGSGPVCSLGHDGQPDRHRRAIRSPATSCLCSTTSHVYVWEAGGIARLWGVTARTFAGRRRLALARRPARRHPARRRRALRPDPADLSGKHPQSRRRASPPDRRASPRFRGGLASTTWPCIWMERG